MLRSLFVLCALLVLAVPALAANGELKGDYLETRTCDVYTGPCFANGQVGLTGKDAIMAWSIDRGSFEGVSLAGTKVVIVINSTETLAYGGTMDVPEGEIKSVVIVDENATPEQQSALVRFASKHAEHAGEVVKVLKAPIEMSLDHFSVEARLKAGRFASISTRKLNPGDCVCRNEEVFYPPLCTVKNANPAYVLDGGYNGPSLNVQWENANSRSAFLASFSY